MNVIIVTGLSCAGKTTLVSEAIKRRDNIGKAITFTTREVRNNEINEKDYYFVSEKEFLSKKDFIEREKVYGHFYGTSKESFNIGKEIVLWILDIKGSLKFIGKYPIIFLYANLNDLIKRIEKRGDNEGKKRITSANFEIEFKEKFDYSIETSGDEKNIEKEVDKFLEIIDKITATNQ